MRWFVRVGTIAAAVAVIVSCSNDPSAPGLSRLAATIDSPDRILTLPIGARVPITCLARLPNGAVFRSPLVRSASDGPVTGTNCSDLRVRHSGVDTLMVFMPHDTVWVPIAVAVPPVLQRGDDDRLKVDDMHGLTAEWAPSARVAPDGRIEIYFAGTSGERTPTGNSRTNLYRVSADPAGHTDDPTELTFHFDGLMLPHDSADCAPNGDGIENIVILPRNDAAGWRMLYSSGGFTCYGWQVFSAVSADGDHWTKESGARIPNGGPLPPAPPQGGPWPSGEGMWAEQLPGGEWRLLVGAYEPITPPDPRFQIVEYRSTDQLNWHYVGPVLTTSELPEDARRSVYSPAVREVAPGLWRMIFTADNLNEPGGRSRLYSAVSTDRTRWQLEGVLLAKADTNFFYSALAGDLLVYIAAPPQQSGTLHAATLLMP
ncbi:MAG TPA: hypothetical protein VFL95_02540 [Gemmatimonadales bacterium]|nr:hypothetical protein [Gemmatimonadales bacterium]